ncbi:5-oxoprolinase subunit B family protein [Paracoccaceae bacterium GXU_MW_L88]
MSDSAKTALTTPQGSDFRILPLGDSALILEFPDDERAPARLRAAEAALAGAGFIDIVPAYRSLSVVFDPLTESDPEALLRKAATAEIAEDSDARQWALPVSFAPEDGPDQGFVCEETGLSRDALITALTEARFTVRAIGFLPGFPFMGGLPETLHLPRRADPRTKVPARSFAIAKAMAAIYPVESPGGWHLLGRAPFDLFDRNRKSPALLRTGDHVRIEAVTQEDAAQIQRQIRSGTLSPESFQCG